MNDLKISLLAQVTRRIHGIRTVSSGATNRTMPQAEFVETCRRYQDEAASQLPSLPKLVEGLWKAEGLATTFGKYRLPDNSLNDPQLPPQVLGITHVGYGAASAEFAHFDTTHLKSIFETKCHPNYRGFSEEGMGSTLRIYEPGFFKFMCGVLGLIPKGAPPGPDKDGFFAQFFSAFAPESQRLIAHGYGRLMAFSNVNVYKAVREAVALPDEHEESCVQGIAFAFAMMHSPDMPRLLEGSAIPFPERIRAAFQNGLVYALVFSDWFVPGFLSTYQPRGSLETKLIDLARAEAALNVKRGYPLAFWLENPIAPRTESHLRL